MFGLNPEYNWKVAVEEALEDFEYIGLLIKKGNINQVLELLKLIEKKIAPFELNESKAPKEIDQIREKWERLKKSFLLKS